MNSVKIFLWVIIISAFVFNLQLVDAQDEFFTNVAPKPDRSYSECPSPKNNDDTNLYEECINRYAVIEDLQKWYKFGDLQINGDVKKVLQEKLQTYGEDIIEESIDTPYLANFFKNTTEKVASMASDLDKKWGDKYIEKIQSFSNVQTLYLNFFDEKRQLITALDTLLSQKKRLHSLQKVFLQQISGIPTTYLIAGRSKWKAKMGKYGKINDKISNGAQSFIKKNLRSNLIFHNAEVKDSKIAQNVIISVTNLQVEEHGADPFTYMAPKQLFILQRYRCFPRYDKPESETNLPVSNQTNDIQYWHLGHNFFEDELPASLISDARDEFKKVSQENESNIAKIDGFEERYKKSWKMIDEKKNKNIKKMWDVTNQLTEKIYYELREPDMVSIRRNLSEPVRRIEDMSYRDIEAAENLTEDIDTYLDGIAKRINSDKTKKRKDIDKLVQQKNIVMHTIKSKILGSQDDPQEEAYKLLKGEIDTLTKRKLQLRSYEFSVVEAGKLKTYKGSEYYNDGIPFRYLIFPVILKHKLKKDRTSEYMRISLFLAWEVEYSKKDKKKKLDIYYDVENNLNWFIDIQECFSFEKAKKRLPANFVLPTLDEMNFFIKFLEHPGAKQMIQKHNHLKKLGNEFWTIEIDDLTDKIFTFDIGAKEQLKHHSSFCGYIIGKKL